MKKMKVHYLATVFVLFATTVFGEVKAPKEVQAAIAREVNACKEFGKRPVVNSSTLINGDVNGDGSDDYVIDVQGIDGCAPVLCGSGGCGLTLFLSGPKGSLKRAWDGLGFDPKIGKGHLTYKTRSGVEKVVVKGQSAK